MIAFFGRDAGMMAVVMKRWHLHDLLAWSHEALYWYIKESLYTFPVIAKNCSPIIFV